ncbi:hypothetical protein [Streptomyces sp. ODS28]|uniref:hypothetical protein n=1 Tax=Streptomyces sp. ODS28 TaxID=3136688 RepID=UPI0031E86A98
MPLQAVPPRQRGAAVTLACCCECGVWDTDAVLVRIVETGSGTGGMIYACPQHAPDWLRQSVADTDPSDSEGQP